MWDDAQRSAEYRPIGGANEERKFSTSLPCPTPQLGWRRPLLEFRAVTLPCNIGELKTRTQSEFRIWQNSVRGQEPKKCIYVVYHPWFDGQVQSLVDLRWATSVQYNEAKTRKPLIFAGVSQTRQPISVVSGPKFTILSHVWRYCCLKSFFPIVDTSLLCEDIARQRCSMVYRWRFLRNFCVLYFQRAVCSTFQTCILNSH